MVLVSVCIPCWADFSGLRESLVSLSAACKHVNPGLVQIVVGLNECDFTDQDILAFLPADTNLSIRTGRTDGYLEYDESLEFTVNLAESDYCLLLGCGDRVLPTFAAAISSFEEMAERTDFALFRVEANKRTFSDIGLGRFEVADPGIFNKVLSGHLFSKAALLDALDGPRLGFLWAHIDLALNVQGRSLKPSFEYSQAVIFRPQPEGGWWHRVDMAKQYIEYCALIETAVELYPRLHSVRLEQKKLYGIRILLTLAMARANGLTEMPSFLVDWVFEKSQPKLIFTVIRLLFVLPRQVSGFLVRGLTFALATRAALKLR